MSGEQTAPPVHFDKGASIIYGVLALRSLAKTMKTNSGKEVADYVENIAGEIADTNLRTSAAKPWTAVKNIFWAARRAGNVRCYLL